MSNEHPTPPEQQPPGPPGPYGPPGAQSPYGQGPYGAQPGPYGTPPAPGAQPPYPQPPYPQPPYPQQPGAFPPPQPGAHAYGWTGTPPYYGPSQPPAMPGPVRAAQIVIFATLGAGVLLSVVVAAGAGAESSGRFFSTYLMTVVLCVLAFRFHTAGNGVRVACQVLSVVQILFTLSATAQGVQLGIVPLGSAIAVLVLLSQGSAKQWFRRHSENGVPPQYS